LGEEGRVLMSSVHGSAEEAKIDAALADLA
jgi:hypothetical protein